MVSRVTILLLGGGMMLCLLQPASAGNRSESFAAWLNSAARQAEDPQLREEIDRLRHTRMEFDRMISRAAEIVSRNTKDFNLPVERAESPGQVFNMLLSGWNQFRTGNAMNGITQPESPNPFLSQRTDLFPVGSPPVWASAGTGGGGDLAGNCSNIVRRTPALQPMIHGIAIGAP